MFSCSSNKIKERETSDYSAYLKEYNKSEIDSIIENHSYTFVYVWTNSCGACEHVLIEEIAPYLKNKPDSIGFVSMAFSPSDIVLRFMEKYKLQIPTYICSNSQEQENGKRMDEILNTIFEDHNPTTGVPMTILCDRKKNIFNKELSYFAFNYSKKIILKELAEKQKTTK
jgi:hypothetical protein